MAWFSRYVGLSLPRLWMRELLFFATKAPIAGGTSLLRVADLVAARQKQQPLISWGAILLKAIALTSERFPELKRCYMPMPWGHFYEHPHCVGCIVIERRWRGENAVFFHQMAAANKKSLREIDRELRWLKTAEVEAVGSFRRLIRNTRFPPPIRRLLLRVALYGSGRVRSRYLGTFLFNSVPSRRAFATQSMTVLPISFFYGAVQPNGDMPMQMFFDHRVIDGVTAARLVIELNAILCREIVAELNAGG